MSQIIKANAKDIELPLFNNPFHILGATVRDNRSRLIELVDDKSLVLDAAVVSKARTDLTTPKNRLSAEVSWFPGLSPRSVNTYLEKLYADPEDILHSESLPALTKANLIANLIAILREDVDVRTWANCINNLAYASDKIDPEEVLRAINEDRSNSGYPAIQSVDLIEEELGLRRRFYSETVRSAIDALDSQMLVKVVTSVAETTTDSGEYHAPVLVHDIIDRYEIEANRFLEPEAENILKLIESIRENASKGNQAVVGLVNKLIQITRNWDFVAQPIQLSTKAQGLDHVLSHKIAWSIRSLSIDLFNKFDMLDLAKQLNSMLVALFDEVPEVAEKVSEDSQALCDISEERQQGKLLESLVALCESISQHAEKYPTSADQDGFRVLREGKAMVSQLPIQASSSLLINANNRIAAVAMHCAIEYGNKTSRWGQCVTLLEGALEVAVDIKLRQKINENLSTVRQNERQLGGLEPISSAPSLSTINGCGFTLYGSTDLDSSNGSYLSTYYFVLLAIPIFPISRYRVIPTGGGYRFLGKSPLRTMDIWHIVISVAIIVWMFSH